ncbi:MAG: MFS transporter, partial [Actinobacteria bacterium]|nr:MFS transporter [Actinomycetota bacterium]
MPASLQTRELLADPPFMVLLAARTVSMLGMAFAPVALAFGVLAMPGADAGTLSIVLAAQTIPLVAFMLVGGVIADRYPRALVLRWGQIVAAAAWASIGIMMLSGHTPLWLLCLAAAFAGLAGA